MTAGRVSPVEHGQGALLGCVVRTEVGVLVVLTDRGELRASFGGGMLARIARDRAVLPALGDWVVLRRWCDDRVTVEARLESPLAPVIPLVRR